jgi:hypothetical protein
MSFERAEISISVNMSAARISVSPVVALSGCAGTE